MYFSEEVSIILRISTLPKLKKSATENYPFWCGFAYRHRFCLYLLTGMTDDIIVNVKLLFLLIHNMLTLNICVYFTKCYARLRYKKKYLLSINIDHIISFINKK